MNRIIIQWYLLQLGICQILEGCIRAITLGYWSIPLGLWAAKAVAMKRAELKK